MTLLGKQRLSCLEHPILLPASLGFLILLLLTVTLGTASRAAAHHLEAKARQEADLLSPAEIAQLPRNYFSLHRDRPLQLTAQAERLGLVSNYRYYRLLPSAPILMLLGKDPIPASLYLSHPSLPKDIECRLNPRQNHRPDYQNGHFLQEEITLQGLYLTQNETHIVLSPCFRLPAGS